MKALALLCLLLLPPTPPTDMEAIVTHAWWEQRPSAEEAELLAKLIAATYAPDEVHVMPTGTFRRGAPNARPKSRALIIPGNLPGVAQPPESALADVLRALDRAAFEERK